MVSKNIKYPDQELFDFVMNELKKRNINSHTVGEAAYQLQHQYLPELTIADFGYQLNEILKKREVLNTLALGFEIDNLATEKKLSEPLQTIIEDDLGIFGLDELLAMNISQLYGSLSVSNFGFADKIKVGIAKDLDIDESHVQTFSDDLFSALVSAVIGRCGNGAKLDLKKTDTDNTGSPQSVEDTDASLADDVMNNLPQLPLSDTFIGKPRLLSAPITTYNGIPINNYDAFKNFVFNDYIFNHDLVGQLEELFNHDYFIDIVESKDDALFLTFNDNSMIIEKTATIDLHELYDYIRSTITHDWCDYSHTNDDTFTKLVHDFIVKNDKIMENDSKKPKRVEDIKITKESIDNFLDEISPYLNNLLRKLDNLEEENYEQQ